MPGSTEEACLSCRYVRIATDHRKCMQHNATQRREDKSFHLGETSNNVVAQLPFYASRERETANEDHENTERRFKVFDLTRDIHGQHLISEDHYPVVALTSNHTANTLHHTKRSHDTRKKR